MTLVSPKPNGENIKESRLVVSEMSGASNRPMALGVSVDPIVSGTTVVVRGLQTGSRLTVGAPEGNGAWRVSIRDLAHAMVIPPLGFAGTMNATVDLRRSDDSVIDSDVLRLNWTDQSPEPMVAKPVTTTVVRSPSTTAPSAFPAPPVRVAPSVLDPTPAQVRVEPSPAAAAAPAPAPAAAPAPAVAAAPAAVPAPAQRRPDVASARQMDREELRNLLNRGEAALQVGDLASARLLLGRAAEAGDINAALAIGATYDPRILAQRGVIGARPDIAQARTWYQKAADSGSAEAKRRLQDLAQQ
jgi:hypothetical protein